MLDTENDPLKGLYSIYTYKITEKVQVFKRRLCQFSPSKLDLHAIVPALLFKIQGHTC